MRRFNVFRGMMSAVLVCGLLVFGFSGNAFAAKERKEKKDFSKAPVIQKLFFLTVCGHGDPFSRYVTSKDGKRVCDRTTGNVWEQNLQSSTRDPMTLAEAEEFCALLDHGHGTQYALPTVQQLFSVLDFSESMPALPEGVFSDAPSLDQFWTSTPYLGLGPQGRNLVVQIAAGPVRPEDGMLDRRVWCVQATKKGHHHRGR